ncbi:16S rRNA (guanine(966)-N(2))-methyltransferase RsmD [Pelagibacteraceae bacterium]|jgi:16S rRNA (guanine966-N2)-methyltransferase|nr:16S rRNA (guanine(966)-N(2))-methyltransferase RsmD [Pelagibacteraceae bacterium]
MRVVSGFLKRKKIEFLKSLTTRPLRDFVKESIFNIIEHSNLINVKLENSNILDFYSGVGSFGIECISRGAKKTTFVENDSKVLLVLKKNIDYLRIENKSNIIKNKIISFIGQFKDKSKFDIIFFDPPFAENYFINELKLLKKSNIFAKDHLIIIHREKKTRDDLSGILNILTTKNYGRSKVIFGDFNLSIS